MVDYAKSSCKLNPNKYNTNKCMYVFTFIFALFMLKALKLE